MFPFGYAGKDIEGDRKVFARSQGEILVITLRHFVFSAIGYRGFGYRIINAVKECAVLLPDQACGGSKAFLILIRGKERKSDVAVLRKRAGRNAHAVIGKDPWFPIIGQSLGGIAAAPLVAVIQNAGHKIILGFETGFELRNEFDAAGAPALIGHPAADPKQAVSQVVNVIPG